MKKITKKVTKKIMPKKISKGMSKKISLAKKVSIGAGVATLGAGAYYLLGPNSKAHKKNINALAKKLKSEWKTIKK